MKSSPVWRLLRRNISASQIAGYAVANLVGLVIVLTAIQFYTDARAALDTGDSMLRRDYLVVSRQVGVVDRDVTFSAADLADLESQPWCEAVGKFTASRYKINIGVDFRGHGMSTETFFESIPDRFFDKLPAGWGFDPAQPDVPIILSKDYLSLYNFGFASTRNLPKFREGEISMVPLDIVISGRGRTVRMRGHIAGFSSRISTIAVPEEFMTWANANYGDDAVPSAPSRLVVEVNDPGNPAVRDYMRRHDLEIAGDKMDNSEASYILAVLTAVVIGVGAVISLLAFFILMLSIYLLLQKSRAKLRDLMLLGYSPGGVSKYYYRLVAWVNGAVIVFAVPAVIAVRHTWTGALEAMDLECGTLWPVLITAVAIVITVTAVNIIVIRRLVRRAIL